MKTPRSIVKIGDSIALGSSLMAIPTPARLDLALNALYPGQFGVGSFGELSYLVRLTDPSSIHLVWMNRVKNQWEGAVTPEIVWYQGGVNDCNAGTASASSITAMATTWDDIRGTGARLIIDNIAPCSAYVGWSAASQTKIEEVNAATLAYSIAHPEVLLIDVYDLLGATADPTRLADGTGGDPNYKAATFAGGGAGDGLHPNDNAAAVIVAATLAGIIAKGWI